MSEHPFLFDLRGRLTFGPARTPAEGQLIALGATQMVHSQAGFSGVYVDNEAGTGPLGSKEQLADRDRIAGVLRASLPKDKLVLVGLYPFESQHRLSGCVCLYEWYPFHKGWGMPTRANLGLSWAESLPEGWIIQWRYSHDGDRAPSRVERWRLYASVRVHHPRLVIGY